MPSREDLSAIEKVEYVVDIVDSDLIMDRESDVSNNLKSC